MVLLSEEQQARRLDASAMRQRAVEIRLYLASKEGKARMPAERGEMRRLADDLRAQAKVITDQLPRADPWSNIIEG